MIGNLKVKEGEGDVLSSPNLSKRLLANSGQSF